MQSSEFDVELRDGRTATVVVSAVVDDPAETPAERPAREEREADLANLLGGYFAGQVDRTPYGMRLLAARSSSGASNAAVRAAAAPAYPPPGFDHAAALRDLRALADGGPPVELGMSAFDGWQLAAALQLACRHPAMVGPVRRVAEEVARRILAGLATTPALSVLAEAGWHAAADVPPTPAAEGGGR